MLSKQIYLSIIIPAYNEEDRIIPTLTHAVHYLAKQNYSSEVIVVSDGSVDNTVRVAEEFSAPANAGIKALAYTPNRGKGYAVKYGMLHAQGQIIMFMDADYAVPIHYCEAGIKLIHKGFDIAMASRALSRSKIKTHQNILRELSARIYTFIQNTYLGIHFPDTQCGFKLFSFRAARHLFREQKLDSVIFDPEILWLAKKAGYRIAQFPVEWTHIENSRIQYDSVRKFLFVFQELFRIKSLHRIAKIKAGRP